MQLKTLTGVVSKLATQGDDTAQKLSQLEARLSKLESAAPAPPAPTPTPPPPTPAPPPPPRRTSKLDVMGGYLASCAACHMEGNEAKGKKFVLLRKDGSRNRLDGEALLSLREHLEGGTMPPLKNKLNIPPLSAEMRTAMLDDLVHFKKG